MTSSFPQNLLNSKKSIVLISSALVGVLLVIWALVAFNNTQKQMVTQEKALNAHYLANQNELSALILSVRESIGIADRSSDKVNDILSAALRARYDTPAAADIGNGKAFSAIVEAYPDLAGVSDGYAKVQAALTAGRTAFKNKQDGLLDKIRAYETWKDSGFIKSTMTSMVGAPSDGLEARIGKKVVRGQEALDQMKLIVLDGETTEAFENGEMKPMDLNPTTPAPAEPAPAPAP